MPRNTIHRPSLGDAEICSAKSHECHHGVPRSNGSVRAVSRREMLALGIGAGVGMLASPVLARASALAESVRRGAAGEAPDAVEIATRAARWIRTARIETASGITWPADPTKPASVETDLYNGMPGVILFHLELYYATGDATWLDEAKAGADELIAQVPSIDKSGDWGLYTGVAGAAFVLEETHRATGDGRYRDASRRAIELIHAAAMKAGDGVSWPSQSATNDIISGSSGIGLTLLYAYERMSEPNSRELALAAGRHLIGLGQPAAGGLKWAVAPTVQKLYPNFSHGTAGVSYFLATLYETTGDRSFLDAALAGARYLEAVATKTTATFKVFHDEPGGEDLYYLAWCHGPAGTSRLFYRLAAVTHDDRWIGLVRQCARAIIDSGIPEQRTPGFWNNISQCCGNAGVGEYFLTLQRIMPDDSYPGMIRRIVDDTLRRATSASTPNGEGIKWIQAENRIQPDVVVAQTGFMQGAAGVGTLLLHAAARARTDRPAPTRIVWPDSPFA